MAWWPSTRDDAARYFATVGMRNEWRWIVDNHLGWYGETDYDKRTIRINILLHRIHRESLIDTLVHEELHILFPRYGEKMSKQHKARLYRLVSRSYKPKRTVGR